MKCERCGGSGSNNETNPRLREPCPDCNGTGNQPESKWTSCDKCKYGKEDLCTNEIRNKTIISRDEYGNCKFYKNPDPPEESQSEYQDGYDAGFMAGKESRDEEVEKLKQVNLFLRKQWSTDRDLFDSDMLKANKEIKALRAQIEEMRCCGNCIDYYKCKTEGFDGSDICGEWVNYHGQLEKEK